jgi:Domain of unknown function (DUF4913)
MNAREPAEEREPVYRSGAEFHREYLSIVFARADSVWCPEWQKHAEAREVIDAVWRSWEDAQHSTHDGLARWFTYYGYPLMRELMDPAGTFAGCLTDRHSPKTEALPE